MAFGTYDQLATYLETGYWTSVSEIAHQWANTSVSVNITGLTAADQTLAREALGLYADVSGLNFTFVTGSADITYDDVNSGAVTNASWYLGSGNMVSAAVNIGTSWGGGVGSGIESYRFQTFIHETGHALGLGHQGPYNNSANYPSDAAYDNDSWQLSVMSYFDQIENSAIVGSYAYALTPQLVDILAIQNMYGAGSVRTGNTTYGDGNNTGRASYGTTFTYKPTVTIYDSGGIDTMNYSGYSGSQIINLAAEGMSSVYGEVNNIIIARGVTIEDAVGGSGNDSIYGNNADNTLTGNGGNDVMYGFDGNDTFRYVNGVGAGTGEQIFGGNGHDKVLLDTYTNGQTFDFRGANGNSIEEIEFKANGANLDVAAIFNADVSPIGSTANLLVDGNDNTGSTEAIIIYMNTLTSIDLSGWTFQDWGGQGETIIILGDTDNETIIGSSQIDYIYGGGGADWLFGGASGDMLDGGGQNDYLYGEAGIDFIYGGDGDDSIAGGIDGDYLYGQNGVDFIWGEDGADWLFGGASGDMLDGGGQNDYLYGEAGIDFIYGGDGDDSIAGGIDGDYLYGQNGADFIWGEDGADWLFGGAGDDILDGGTGNDTMYGGTGNDGFLLANGTGQDTIGDFTAGAGTEDYINISAFGFASFAALLAASSNQAYGVLIQLDGDDSLILSGLTKSQLHVDDFIL